MTTETFVIVSTEHWCYLSRVTTRHGYTHPLWTSDITRAKVWRTRKGVEAFLLLHPAQPFIARPLA